MLIYMVNQLTLFYMRYFGLPLSLACIDEEKDDLSLAKTFAKNL